MPEDGPASPEADTEAASLLRQAQAEHAAGKIDQALALAQRAIEVAPAFAAAWGYVGTTLVTRRLDYDAGLEALEHAAALAPNDAGVFYSLGWCEEFAAYRIERGRGRSRYDAVELYGRAAGHLRRCLELDPEEKLRDDAQDLLEAIENRR